MKQRISEDPLTTHDGCGGAVRRLISPAPFILKGEGWYVTDYPSAARKKALESEKGGDKAAPSSEKSAEKSATTSSDSATTPAPSSTSGSSTASS